MEKIQYRALKFIFNDFDSDYNHILALAEKKTLLVNRVQLLATEVFKCVNNIAPEFVCELFEHHQTPYSLRDSSRLEQRKFKTKRHGFRSF